MILFDEFMASVIRNAFDADVFVICFAIKLVRFVVEGTKLVIASDLLLMACQLKHDEVFAQHVRLDLRIMFEPTSRTI